MFVENVEVLKNNCREYAKSDKNVEILRKANGKRSYAEIAGIVGIHKTRASGLLKMAEKFGLAKKIKPGIYQKIPGILGFMPSNSDFKDKQTKTVNGFKQKTAQKISLPKKQFPNSLAIQPRIISSFDKMIMAYGNLYKVENSLRELIRKVFEKEKDWWKKYTPIGVKNAVQDNIDKAPYHAVTRKDELEYTHLGQLMEIILCNWNKFLPYLKEKDKGQFSATVVKAIPSRNAVGHCIPLESEDLRIVDVRFQDILNMIK